MASRIAAGSSFLARFSASIATSRLESLKPSGCVHCLPVADSYASQYSCAVCPVSGDLNGEWCDHHTSVDIPAPRSPRASTAVGNSTAFGGVTILGLKFCWAHCVQNVANCGGLKMPQTISALAFFRSEICAVKSSDSGG